jgi:Kef-type K+ transport system membrane component KefB/mannitol/fructose-specific phosphotransferase system IIA component (Ntr-type)
VGILLMMLYIGMEIDPDEIRKSSKGGVLAALGGFITPFVLCYLAVVGFGESQVAGIFVGIAAGVTSLATKSRILADLRLLDTRLAHTMMAGALMADTLSLVLFAGILGFGDTGEVSAASLGLIAVKAVGYFAVAAFVGLKVLPRFGGYLKDTSTGRTVTFTLLLLITLVFAEGAELVGLHGILGAFLAGLFLREGLLGRRRTKEIMDLVRDASIGFLAPIFFVTAGFSVSLGVFQTDLGLLLLVVGLATVGKIVGTALFYLPTGNGWREGVVLGAGMNGRGAVEIILAGIALERGMIDEGIFSILVIMALATTALVPLFLKWGTDWLRSRGELARSDQQEGTLVVGAGPTARLVAKAVAAYEPVAVLDRNADLVAKAQAEGLAARAGNALDEATLTEAGASRVRRLIALTPNADVNTLVAQQAREVFQVPEIYVPQLGEDRAGHAALVDYVGGATLFGGPADLTGWDYLATRGAGVHTYPVAGPGVLEDMLQALPGDGPALPLGVLRGGELFLAERGHRLEAGDVLVALRPQPKPVEGPFRKLFADAEIIDLDGPLGFEAYAQAAAGPLARAIGDDPAYVARQLAAREQGGSTVIAPGLAVPHVRVKGTGRFALVVIRCREGVRFPDQSSEDEPVRALFALASSLDRRARHLRTLSAVAQVAQRDDFDQAWRDAPSPEALRRLLIETPRAE